MEPLKFPSEADIRIAARQGEDAVVAVVFEVFRKLAERIQQLEGQVAKDSDNSSKPPSSDGLAKKPKSLSRMQSLGRDWHLPGVQRDRDA